MSGHEKNKTREKEKDIKALDKSAVIGQRMKTAFLRSKRNAESLMDKDDRQNTPTGYAVDQVEFAADDLGHDAVNAAASGTKLAIKQGTEFVQRQREKRASEGGREHTTPAEQAPASEPVDLGRQIPGKVAILPGKPVSATREYLPPKYHREMS